MSPKEAVAASAILNAVQVIQRLESDKRHLVTLLKQTNRKIEEDISNRDGCDNFDWQCPNCDGALPLEHSLGCAVRNALLREGVR